MKLDSLKDKKIINKPTKEDHNFIMRQIIMSYAFRVFRIIIIIFSVSYFIGTLWYIFTWLTDDGYSAKGFFFGEYRFRDWKKNNKDLDG